MIWATRCATSSAVMELTGWAITTGSNAFMPTAWRVSSVSRANSVVMITALGTPSRSSAMESRTQAEQHLSLIHI